MKAYPLTEAELTTLGVIQGASAFFFAIAGTCGGFWMSVKQTVAFAGKDTPVTVITYWQAIGTCALIGAMAFALLGTAAFGFSGWRIRSIKSETEHL